MKSIGFVYRPNKEHVYSKACHLSSWLVNKGFVCYHHPEQEAIEDTSKLTDEILAKLDLVVVLGGDGTYLNAVRMLGKHTEVPILGINMGFLGFLTQVRSENLKQIIIQAIEGKLSVCKRSMLKITLIRPGGKKISTLALNDIVFERGNFSRLISMSITIDDTVLCDLKADGLIVATPTGSTAYNLSAGGPILAPGIPAIVITPICPHSLTNRPLTIPNTSQIQLKLTYERQKAIFMIDGYRQVDLTNEDTILITNSDKLHHMLLPPESNQLEVLRSKLRFGQRD